MANLYNAYRGILYRGYNEAARQKINDILIDIYRWDEQVYILSNGIRKSDGIIDSEYYYLTKGGVAHRSALIEIINKALLNMKRLTINPVNYS